MFRFEILQQELNRCCCQMSLAVVGDTPRILCRSILKISCIYHIGAAHVAYEIASKTVDDLFVYIVHVVALAFLQIPY